jgi:hypothetical protein
MPPIRFVILHHATREGEHWDFMIERTDALATWRLEREPAGHAAERIPATRIHDHRKAYLQYEGPISQDRGHVTRVEEGACEILEESETAIQFHLRGRRIHGTYVLTVGEGGQGEWRPLH